MNFSQIDCFKQVMIFGSMSAAARHLDVSQSMVSRTIASLESELGLRLFARTRKGIKATTAADLLYVEVQRSFRGMDVIAQSAREIREAGTTRLQVASIPIIASALLPAAIRRFGEALPGARVSFEMRSEITVYRWASSGVCDIGFSSIYREPFHVDIKNLYRLKGICVLPRTHRLAKRRTQLTLRDLAKERLILPPQNDVIRQRVDILMRRHQISVMPVVETPYAATVCSLVDEGVGLGIVNPLSVRMADASKNLALLPLEDGPEYNGYQLSRAVDINPAVQTFSEAIAHALNDTLARAREQGLVD